MADLELKHIGVDDLKDLDQFLSGLGSGELSFRYFKTRPLTIIDHHIYTLLIYEGEETVGYGHLDPDQDIVWLGIAVHSAHKGKGIGVKIMQHLIEFAEENHIAWLHLTVDRTNLRAIGLFEKFGFKKVDDNRSYLTYRRQSKQVSGE